MIALRPLVMLVPYLRRRRGLFFGVVAVATVGMLAAVAVSVLSVSAAAALVTAEDLARAAASALVIAVVASVGVAGLAAWAEQWFAHVLAYRVIDALRIDVHRTIARLAPVGLARRRTGDTVAAAMGDVESLEWFAAHTVAQVTAGVLACAIVDTTAVVLFGPVWLLLVPAQIGLMLIPLSFVRRAGRQGEVLRAALARVSGRVLAARSAARDVVLLGRVDAEARAVADETRAVQRARRGLAMRAGVEQACTDAMTVAVLLTTLLVAGSAVAGGMDATIAPTLVVLAAASLGPAAIAAGALARVGETAQAARRVDAVLRAPDVRPVDPAPRTVPPRDAEPRPSDPGAEPRPGDSGVADPRAGDPGAEPPPGDSGVADPRAGDPGAEPRPGDPGAEPRPGDPGAEPRPGDPGVVAEARHPGFVEARALTAIYPGADAPALAADLRIAPGEHVAVVGPSGAGKTTLALVLARLLASRGTLLVDDVDTSAEAGADTRRRVVLVPQQPHVFRASVRDNLLAPDADDAALWDALERARLAAHVRRLPDGLDTVLAERGATWSGGERQRLGLARALLREPSVLVLDEPTASLDTATEAEFLAALSRSRAGRTTIAITHRPTLMRTMDRVLFVDDGRVADTAPHAELRERSARYRAVVDGIAQKPSAQSDPERR